jgi:ankyrin repeat protein
MMYYFRYCLYLFVFVGYSCSVAGSYDDFFSALKQDDVATVKMLLGRGFDPNTLSPAGEHGLIVAVREPSLQVILVLLEAPKVNVEVRTQQDESPLMLAALKGLSDLCRQLIALGADVNKPGWTPLHYAATNGHLTTMELLLDEHAYIDAASPNGTTPLMMAARYGTAEAVKLLLGAGADPGLKNDQGLSAIDFAHRASRTEAAELIAAAIRGRQPKGSW